jgi:hypothetical protein
MWRSESWQEAGATMNDQRISRDNKIDELYGLTERKVRIVEMEQK